MNKPGTFPKYILLAALLLALAFQGYMLFNTHAYRLGEIYRSMGQHGLWRSANFAFGQKMANFYGFLNEKIPLDTTVAIPVLSDSPVPLMRMSYVEFFLQPRLVEYCESTPAACLERLGDENYAVLISDLQALPGKEAWGTRLQVFDEDWAVLLPDRQAAGLAWSPYSSLFQILSTSLPAVLLLFALVLPGSLLARQMLPREQPLLHLALGIGSGIGWFTLGLYLALLSGAQLSPALLLGIVALYWLATAAAILPFGKVRKPQLPANLLQQALTLLVLLTPVVLAFILSIGNGFTTTDELVLWGAKGYGIPAVGLAEGVTQRGTLTTWYPLNVPLILSSFLVLFGERLPESKLVFPLFLVGSTGLVYSLLRKHTTPLLSVLGSLLFSTTPLMFSMATLAHGNLPFSFYLVGGTLMLYYAQLSSAQPRRGYWLWGVLLLVFAAWTRPEGIHLAWAVALAALLFYHRTLLKQRTKALLLLLGMGLYSAFWMITSPIIYYKPGFTDGAFSTALQRILEGEWHFWEAGFILQSLVTKFLQPQEWGSMGWVVVLSAVFVIAAASSKSRNYTLLGFGLVVLLSVYAAFWANTYTTYTVLDIGNWMDTSFMRLVLPGLILVWLHLVATAAGIYFPLNISEGQHDK